MHLPLLPLVAGCGDDADLTYGIVCEDASISDEAGNGTSLEANPEPMGQEIPLAQTYHR